MTVYLCKWLGRAVALPCWLSTNQSEEEHFESNTPRVSKKLKCLLFKKMHALFYRKERTSSWEKAAQKAART